MTSRSNLGIPLLASDQAEVIKIYNELKRRRNLAASSAEPRLPVRPVESGDNSTGSQPPNEMFDYE